MGMELGGLISRLQREEDLDKVIKDGFAAPHSYRGYYEQLAFEPTEGVTVRSMLECAESALGATFEGYKGGKYVMEEHTDVWLAHHGCTGDSIGYGLLNYMLLQPQANVDAHAIGTGGKVLLDFMAGRVVRFQEEYPEPGAGTHQFVLDLRRALGLDCPVHAPGSGCDCLARAKAG